MTEKDKDWEGSLHLSIQSVYQLREALRYLKQMWPGSPARPAEEQEFLDAFITVLNQLSLEHSFEFLDKKSDD